MPTTKTDALEVDEKTLEFYRDVLLELNAARLDYLVGGAFALAKYTGIQRQTKDLDIFLKPETCPRVLKILSDKGYRTELLDPVWLGKAFSPGGAFVDFIFRSGNGLAEVDDGWFHKPAEGSLLGVTTRFCPPEETIWSKAFIMERGRYDGADVAHYLLACGATLNWYRLLKRFDPHWRVLFSHLVLFGFIYPDHRDLIPKWVMVKMMKRLSQELHSSPSETKVCQGTLLSRVYYLMDVGAGYRDGRFRPSGTLTDEAVEQWKAAVERDRASLLEEAGVSPSEALRNVVE